MSHDSHLTVFRILFGTFNRREGINVLSIDVKRKYLDMLNGESEMPANQWAWASVFFT